MDTAGGQPFDGHGQAFVLPSPVGERRWVESDGTVWRLRGDGRPMPLKRVEHLVLSPQVRVLHLSSEYEGMVAEVAPEERQVFWLRIRPYLRGTAVRGPNDQTDFNIAEFKNVGRQSMVIVRETC